jgi:hypothetical protein
MRSNKSSLLATLKNPYAWLAATLIIILMNVGLWTIPNFGQMLYENIFQPIDDFFILLPVGVRIFLACIIIAIHSSYWLKISDYNKYVNFGVAGVLMLICGFMEIKKIQFGSITGITLALYITILFRIFHDLINEEW